MRKSHKASQDLNTHLDQHLITYRLKKLLHPFFQVATYMYIHGLVFIKVIINL